MERKVHPYRRQSRIAPLPVEEMRAEWLETLARIPGNGLKGEGFPRNVLGTLMYEPNIMGPFLDYWVTSKLKMSLSVREQELIILRMACLYASDYVWKHHVPVGYEFGIKEEELNALKCRNYKKNFSEREHTILSLTDELVEARTIRPKYWQKYGHKLNNTEMVDLISLVSQYVLFTLVNNAFQVQIEASLNRVRSLKE